MEGDPTIEQALRRTFRGEMGKKELSDLDRWTEEFLWGTKKELQTTGFLALWGS